VAGKEQYDVLKGPCGSVYSSIQGWHDQRPMVIPFGADAQYEVVPKAMLAGDMAAVAEVAHQGAMEG
jgi:hypothetical protein